ncbi:MAG: SUMF1/EgtB/PvdO family nonheme iron enzyme [Planctomycetes bacterium]|nr:SUMF1/EgtB/PvdO family nonheme iron enzyme [Planctomycetota bacterium]
MVLEPNQSIGPWILVRPLGQGTFGEVWLARHAELHVECAVKIPTDNQYLRQLRQEGQIQFKLRHENIVRTIDLDTTHDPPYYVMQYIQGVTLRQKLRATGKLATAETVSILVQVLNALAYAHGKGVMHRDLKPENLLIQADGQVMVTDFGLGMIQAAVAQSIVLSGSLVSDQGRNLSGTVQYMSPQQQAGEAPDQRDDLYALGMIACEMFTGSRPTPAGVAKMLERAGAEKRFADWLERALESERADRFCNAAAMRQALADVVADDAHNWEPADLARPTAMPRQAPMPTRRLRRPVVIAGYAAVISAVVFGAAWIARDLWMSRPPDSLSADQTQQVVVPAKGSVVLGDVLPLKNRADVAWQRIKGIDRSQGFAAMLDGAAREQALAEASWARGSFGEARSAYNRLLEQCNSIEQAHLRRASTLVAKPEQERLRKVAELLAQAKANDSKENGKTAIAKLDELLAIEPGHAEATRLKVKIANYYPPRTLTNSIGMKLIEIKPGEFLMGSPADEENRRDDETQHKVMITKAFMMGAYEVTQKQWELVTGSNPSHNTKGDDLPIDTISWDGAMEFCRKLSRKEGKKYRLPTEAEWEYACRSGTQTPYGGTGNLDEMGWHKGNSDSKLHPIGQKRPNVWGLYDMHGNMQEWCADWYDTYPAGAAIDPTGPANGSLRVMRGGSSVVEPRHCRSAARTRLFPVLTTGATGFRVCLELE